MKSNLIQKTFRLLEDATIPELPNHYRGKVRDCYDLPDGRRIMIASDRLSAFDRHICSIPYKGQVLTQTAQYWFERTAKAVPNHVLEYLDPNVMLVKSLKIIPIEIIVRDYLAGTTSTSILKLYEQGERRVYGTSSENNKLIELPDGLRPNEKLPETIITPTTKSAGHDQPISPEQIFERDLMTRSQWDTILAYALYLFEHGRKAAARHRLILADTKYEFGLDEEGNIILADEIHTPDSSRYWDALTYKMRFDKGEPPTSWDKDIIRTWVAGQCNPYEDEIPEIPPELVARTMMTYISTYQMITGKPFEPAETEPSPLDRIRRNLAFTGWRHHVL